MSHLHVKRAMRFADAASCPPSQIYCTIAVYYFFWIVASWPCGLFMLYMLLIVAPWASEQVYFMLPNGLIAEMRYHACLLQMRARSSEQNMIALFSWQMSQVAASFSFSRLTRSCFFTPFPGPCILQSNGICHWMLDYRDPVKELLVNVLPFSSVLVMNGLDPELLV